jgi:hypothetical protein
MRFFVIVLSLWILLPFKLSAPENDVIPEPVFSERDSLPGPLVVQDGSQISPKFRAAMEQHAINTFEWQLAVSKQVMWLVFILSTAGVLFSAIQLLRLFPVRFRGAVSKDLEADALTARILKNIQDKDAKDPGTLKQAINDAFEVQFRLSAGAPVYASDDRRMEVPETKLMISNGKIEVTTAIAGIAVLLISLGALYLFLRFVYTIKVVVV